MAAKTQKHATRRQAGSGSLLKYWRVRTSSSRNPGPEIDACPAQRTVLKLADPSGGGEHRFCSAESLIENSLQTLILLPLGPQALACMRSSSPVPLGAFLPRCLRDSFTRGISQTPLCPVPPQPSFFWSLTSPAVRTGVSHRTIWRCSDANERGKSLLAKERMNYLLGKASAGLELRGREFFIAPPAERPAQNSDLPKQC